MGDSTSIAAGADRAEDRRRDLRGAISAAAVDLVIERGLDAVTVDEIARAANVSRRTFFNYFPSKEDAVLGLRAPALDPALLEGFSLDRDVLEQVSRLLLAVARSAHAGGDAQRRRELMGRYPHLAQRRRELMSQAEDLVHRAVTHLLAEHPAWSAGVAGHDVAEAARMLVMLAGVPLRFALTPGGAAAAAAPEAPDLAPAFRLFYDLQRNLS